MFLLLTIIGTIIGIVVALAHGVLIESLISVFWGFVILFAAGYVGTIK